MSFNGGYKCIDLSGCAFTKDEGQSSETQNVFTSSKEGIYQSIMNTNNKCLRLVGMTLENVLMDEQLISRSIDANGFVTCMVGIQDVAVRTALAPEGKVYTYNSLAIGPNDAITFTVMGM